jgi:hypothetical protein
MRVRLVKNLPAGKHSVHFLLQYILTKNHRLFTGGLHYNHLFRFIQGDFSNGGFALKFRGILPLIILGHPFWKA